MRHPDFELLGIALTFSKVWRRIKIQNVYKVKGPDGKEHIAIENAVDQQATLSFSRIVDAFEQLYEQRIEKTWICESEHVKARYYQFDKFVTPDYACLPGHWLWWSQR